jgi:ABC-type glycerol-3-phosphate transport system substrate-binding protein
MIERGMRLVAAALAAVTVLFLAGCATTGSPDDQPWNCPQPWEGTPNIPGFSQPR